MKLTFVLAFIFCCLFGNNLRGQVTEEWTAIYSLSGIGDESWESLLSFKTDPIGNSYAFGSTSDSTNKSFLVKFDPSGNEEWTSVIDSSSGRRMVMDDSGDIICASWKTTYSSWDSTIVTKLNHDGNIEWQSTYSGYDPTDIGIDYAGEIVILSDMNSSPGDPRILTKLNSSGGIIWSTSFNLGYHEEFGPYFRINADNSIYVITEEFEIIKFNSDGNYVWEKDLDAVLPSHSGFKVSNAIIKDGNILLTGSTEIYNFQNHPHLVACMIDSSGDVSWVDTVAGVLFSGLTVIPFNSYIAVIGIDSSGTELRYLKFDFLGNMLSNLPIEQNDFRLNPTDYQLDGNLNVYLVGYGKDSSSIYSGLTLMKLDSSGNFLWNIYKAGSSECNSYEHPFVSLDQEDNVYVSNTGNPNLSNFSSHDVTVVKYAQSLNAINSYNENESLNVFPNPVASELVLTIAGVFERNYQIQISNQYGHKVACEKIQKGKSEISIPVEKLSSGLYIISLISDQKVISSKWVKL